MKNYLLILLLILLGCSKPDADVVKEVVNDCGCTENLVQVTVVNQHIIKSSVNVVIDCTKNGLVFDKVYSDDRLIQYKEYKCN